MRFFSWLNAFLCASRSSRPRRRQRIGNRSLAHFIRRFDSPHFFLRPPLLHRHCFRQPFQTRMITAPRRRRIVVRPFSTRRLQHNAVNRARRNAHPTPRTQHRQHRMQKLRCADQRIERTRFQTKRTTDTRLLDNTRTLHPPVERRIRRQRHPAHRRQPLRQRPAPRRATVGRILPRRQRLRVMRTIRLAATPALILRQLPVE